MKVKKYKTNDLYEAFRAGILQQKNSDYCTSACCDIIIIKAFEDWMELNGR